MTLAPETFLDEEYEQERGKPLPSLNHGVVQAKLSFALISAYQDQYLVGSEITLATEPPLTPDLIVSSERQLDWLRDEIRVGEAPLTVFEIVTPSQSINEFIPRIRKLFPVRSKIGLAGASSFQAGGHLQTGQGVASIQRRRSRRSSAGLQNRAKRDFLIEEE